MIFISKQISKKVFSILIFLLLFFLFSLHSYAEMEWKLVNQLSTCTYNGITCNDKGLYVAVGSRGIVRTSYNLDWKDSDSTTDSDLFGCTYGGGKFVAVGEKGTIIYSSNGAKWNKVIVDNVNFKDVVFSNGLFVAVGNSPIGGENTGYIYKSSDGIKWTLAGKREQSEYYLYSAKYLNNLFIVLGGSDNGNTEIDYSSDGVNWTKKIVERIINDIIWDDTRYLAIGINPVISVSTNLLDWQSVESNLDPSMSMRKIVKLNGKYLVPASIPEGSALFDGRYFFMSSEDLKKWTRVWNYTELDEFKCFYVNKKPLSYTASEHEGENIDELIAAGVNEETLETHDGRIIHFDSKNPGIITKVLWNGKKFIGAGTRYNFVSSNGANWMKYGNSTEHGFSSVVWNGKCFTGIYTLRSDPEYEEFFQSEDGDTWKWTAEIEQSECDSIYYFDNRYFVTGYNHKIFISPDLKEWTESKADIFKMAWNGKKFIGTNSHTIFTSLDGVNWDKQKSLKDSNDVFENIIWNDKEFLVFSKAGEIFKSSDGLNWTEKRCKANLVSGIWDGSRYVFTSFGGVIVVIDSEGNISEVSHIKELEPMDIAWNGEMYVVVGSAGQIAECVPTDIIKVKVNGTPIAFDVAPVTKEGRNLVPLRAIFDALGASVEWDGATKTITGKKDGSVIKLKLDSNEALINGEKKTLDVPATSMDGRTMVPARFIAESLGASVEWDDSAKTVIITGKK